MRYICRRDGVDQTGRVFVAAQHMSISVRVKGQLREHVSLRIGPEGRFAHAREYVCFLIRRDLEENGRSITDISAHLPE